MLVNNIFADNTCTSLSLCGNGLSKSLEHTIPYMSK